MDKIIERNGYIEQVWKVSYSINGFKYIILIQGTEPEMHAYMTSEFGYVGRYHACNDMEIRAARSLNIPIYIAPRLNG